MGSLIIAPQDLREKYKKEFRWEDKFTPYKLSVFPKNSLAIMRKFSEKEDAIQAFNEEEDTAILQDFSGKEVVFLGYKWRQS